jgi:hypothetical protein
MCLPIAGRARADLVALLRCPAREELADCCCTHIDDFMRSHRVTIRDAVVSLQPTYREATACPAKVLSKHRVNLGSRWRGRIAGIRVALEAPAPAPYPIRAVATSRLVVLVD